MIANLQVPERPRSVKATSTISEVVGVSGSKLMSAKESLERIKQRHTDLADRMTAAEDLDQEFSARALDKKTYGRGNR